MAKTSGTSNQKKPASLRGVKVDCNKLSLDEQLSTEWLRTNPLGAYSSSTVIGCNARRYHGLLVAATNPPVGRVIALSTVMEQLLIGKKIYDLATNEFAGTFAPDGHEMITTFRDEIDTTFQYEIGKVTLKKRVLLHRDTNAVTIRYELKGKADKLLLRPFTNLRDFHSLRHFHQPETIHATDVDGGVRVTEDWLSNHPMYLTSNQAEFKSDPQWWYRVLYRVDVGRGQEGFEDLYSPGLFVWKPNANGKSVKVCEITASIGQPADIDFAAELQSQKDRQTELTLIGKKPSRMVRQLAAATDAFVVQRPMNDGTTGSSITAGYPWFADWGRDTFIALPGLLLSTGRFEQARKVFQTYADHISEGMIPNRFDDYGNPPHYNSMDASLWFILAAYRFIEATGRGEYAEFIDQTLIPACQTIVNHYHDGTRFEIHADDDGLLWGGTPETQLTWMDAKLGDTVITSRYGKAVEINALWYFSHHFLADELKRLGQTKESQLLRNRLDTIEKSFNEVFWNDHFGWLNDYVNEYGADASLRPNQIFAASLPHSPLNHARQIAVLHAVEENLLTPMGLRTLSPNDPRYRRRYGGSWESRERAYHQGTVWAWLIGPFIEAHLKVEDAPNNPKAISLAKKWLKPFKDHLAEAGLGSISEIFDGDAPHRPHGCIAQAWSVAEVLRVQLMVDKLQ